MYSWVSALLKGQGVWTKVKVSEDILQILFPLGVSAQDRLERKFLLCRTCFVLFFSPPNTALKGKKSFYNRN